MVNPDIIRDLERQYGNISSIKIKTLKYYINILNI